LIPKGATVVEIAAGSPEFDGSVTGSCDLQQIVAPPIDHRDFCSKSTAKSRLQVETLISPGVMNRRAPHTAGG
jgi:hypothetical protein